MNALTAYSDTYVFRNALHFVVWQCQQMIGWFVGGGNMTTPSAEKNPRQLV
jgi:hypothetical protein